MDAGKHALVPQTRDAVSARGGQRWVPFAGAAGEMGRRRRRRPPGVHRRRDCGGALVRVGRVRVSSGDSGGGRRLPRAHHPAGPHAPPAAHVRRDRGVLRAGLGARVASPRGRGG